MPERRQHRVSGAQDGRSERPATGRGHPRAAHRHEPAALRPVGFRGKRGHCSAQSHADAFGDALVGGLHDPHREERVVEAARLADEGPAHLSWRGVPLLTPLLVSLCFVGCGGPKEGVYSLVLRTEGDPLKE